MKRRTALTFGILLILFGVLAILRNFLPSMFDFLSWPFTIVLGGAIFILAAIIAKIGGLAIPGVILAGIGGIFYYQNASGDYASWTYMWTLIPGFVGLGIILAGLIDGNLRGALTAGLILIVISLILFFIFGGTFGLDKAVVRWWPLVLIAIGLIILFRQLFRKKV